eukprot:gene36220-44681_t
MPLTDKHTSILSLNYYPPSESADSSTTCINDTIIRVAEHTDVSMLTIVAQSISRPGDITSPTTATDTTSTYPGGGLEILDPSTAQWLSVPYLPGGLVVNVGDCLSDWSGGRLRSARHRVVTTHSGSSSMVNSVSEYRDNVCASDERYSLAYFLAPNYDALMQWPVDHGCTTDGESPSSVADSTARETTVQTPAVNYTTWRKARIKRALEQLHKKQ